MLPQGWQELLQERGVDHRIAELIAEAAEGRAVEPPTTETKQLLIAVEQDGYAAGRVAASTLSLFFEPPRARHIAERYGFAIGERSPATWIVRIAAEELDDHPRRELVRQLFSEALDRVEPLGSWHRGLPDATRTRGGICPIHSVERSVSGDCPMCE